MEEELKRKEIEMLLRIQAENAAMRKKEDLEFLASRSFNGSQIINKFEDIEWVIS